jgi:hypothetical protein
MSNIIPGTDDEPFDLDLGDGHWVHFMGWRPDRSIPSNAERFAAHPDVERWGASVPHLKADGTLCQGFVTFDGPVQRAVHPGAAKWTVESMDPLTLSPSLLCNACKDHGFIRQGKWVRA